METLFGSAFLLSMTFAVQPGVILFEALRRGLVGGWRPALGVELGSLVGDATWALIALLGVAVLFQHQVIAIGLSLFGCGLLLRLAWEAWHAAHVHPTAAPVPRQSHPVLAGAALSLSNPSNLTFWVGISSTIVGLGFLQPEPEHLLVFFVGFMSAQVCWCFIAAALIGLGHSLFHPRYLFWVNRSAAALLTLLSAHLLLGTLHMTL